MTTPDIQIEMTPVQTVRFRRQPEPVSTPRPVRQYRCSLEAKIDGEWEWGVYTSTRPTTFIDSGRRGSEQAARDAIDAAIAKDRLRIELASNRQTWTV